MQVRMIFDIDTETGDYELTFKNVSNPGEGMDYAVIQEMVRRVFEDFDKRADCEGTC